MNSLDHGFICEICEYKHSQFFCVSCISKMVSDKHLELASLYKSQEKLVEQVTQLQKLNQPHQKLIEFSRQRQHKEARNNAFQRKLSQINDEIVLESLALKQIQESNAKTLEKIRQQNAALDQRVEHLKILRKQSSNSIANEIQEKERRNREQQGALVRRFARIFNLDPVFMPTFQGSSSSSKSGGNSEDLVIIHSDVNFQQSLAKNLAQKMLRDEIDLTGINVKIVTDISLPASTTNFDGCNEDNVAAALGYIALITKTLSSYFGVPIRHTLQFRGSKSIVYEGGKIHPKAFPLYSKGLENKEPFYHGLHLLNQCVTQLCVSQGIFDEDPNPKPQVNSLSKIFDITASSAKSASSPSSRRMSAPASIPAYIVQKRRLELYTSKNLLAKLMVLYGNDSVMGRDLSKRTNNSGNIGGNKSFFIEGSSNTSSNNNNNAGMGSVFFQPKDPFPSSSKTRSLNDAESISRVSLPDFSALHASSSSSSSSSSQKLDDADEKEYEIVDY